jgi:outer membrane protein TolC
VQYDAERKAVSGLEYYTYQNAEVKYPTPYAATLKTGIDYANGVNASNELTIGNQSYIGIEMPLLKDLMIDKRRAAIQQAKIYQTLSTLEQQNTINTVLFDASVAYAQWAAAFKLKNLFEEYLRTAQNRVRLIAISYKNGDRSMMDTIEAYTQVQNVSLLLQDAKLKWTQASILLSQFLWTNESKPYLISEIYAPDTTLLTNYILEEKFNERVESAMTNHPLLKIGLNKLQSLEVERKLKKQSLLPTLNIGANLLNKGSNAFTNWNSGYLANNNKLNVLFKMPLLLREGKGNYQNALLKIKEVETIQQNKQWEIQTKMNFYNQEENNINSQVVINNAMLNNFSSLLKNEELRFNQGESSLFLINSRENKVIETKQKQVDLQFKLLKAKYGLIWSSGEFK